jgi:hypothetical protein
MEYLMDSEERTIHECHGLKSMSARCVNTAKHKPKELKEYNAK